ncbi:protein SOB FIVE-LIKE 5 [Capsicum chacoense]|uniref:protein SOB FIVE-LIKE 5 n=1 Tax=Capsicum annuum TaxID=4072 RepID=UPI0007BF4020|nr:protein SOB FIVE-LIKE 5 [Capsicum annuum]KAF3666098.1 putative nucleobase-ascorbate transporter 10-like [Capsicum annuum]KAF3667520.1 putative nucleobase-ascorbate transporter 10-like [Capsicum annuum]
MNISGSECSSGCESGWTMYLDQLSNSADQYNTRDFSNNNNNQYGIYKTQYVVDEDQEDEDMSMVSDASSGPPHFHEEQYCFDENGYIFYPSAASESTKKANEKRKIKEQKVKKQNVYLDDTASSPFSNLPKDDRFYNDRTSMEMVTGFSGTHSKGKSALGKHFGFLKTSVSGRSSSEKSSGLKGRKRQ